MGLNDFNARKQERILPIFILADVSGSMNGDKIMSLNNSVREMVATLAGVEDIRGVFKVCIITFGSTVQVHQALAKVNELEIKEMVASGKTPMGEAFKLVSNLIEDREVVPSTAYSPTIVLVSDGMPTDLGVSKPQYKDYLEWDALKELSNPERRVSKALKLAMGIGEDADKDMLRAFVNSREIPVFQAKDATEIKSFFNWVTMSTVSRMSSVNPNECTVLPTDSIAGFDNLPI